SWGVVCPWARLNAGQNGHLPPAGNLAIVSQSAAVSAAILDMAATKNMGLCCLAGLGGMIDVDFADVLDYLATDPRVGAILLHLERVTNLRKFMSSARAAAGVKPIIVFKTGRSLVGADVPGVDPDGEVAEDSVYDAAFKRAGVIRVNTIEELFDCAELVSKQPRPKGPDLAVITNAVTPGTMALDALYKHGLKQAVLSPETSASVGQVLSQPLSRTNPINIWSEADPVVFDQLIKMLWSAQEIDGILVVLAPQFFPDQVEAARAISLAFTRRIKPIFIVWMGGRECEAGRRILTEAGLPVYETPERAVKAFLHLLDYDRNLRMLQEIPPKSSGRLAPNRAKAGRIIDQAVSQQNRVLSRLDALKLLEAYDLPTVPFQAAANPDLAVDLALKFGFPVRLHRLSRPGGPEEDDHPADIEIKDPVEMREAFQQIVAGRGRAASGVTDPAALIQPVSPPPELRLRMGCRQMAPFGPVIFFGLGGFGPEICLDQSLGLPPLNRLLARRIIEGTRSYKLLEGARRSLTSILPLLEEMLVKLSHLVTDFPEIVLMDINPLLVFKGAVQASAAVAVIQPTQTPSPLHLIISPYPDEYETTAVTKNGLAIFIRPIKPEDAPLLQELWAALSTQTLYYRFSKPFVPLTPELLVRLTQIDYDREIALVALESRPMGERMLGVARLIGSPGAKVAEFAVAVGDPWQGRGVGAQLLDHLIDIAVKRRIQSLWGLVLQENRVMIELALKLGCQIIRTKDSSQLEIRLDLTKLHQLT
ncbi:MAG: GNAT family N-acetyltransferase, partial [Pseudomonadota bacterium]